MNTTTIRRALQALLPGDVRPLEPLVVQPIGFADSSLQVLAELVEAAGRELGQSLVLERGRGDIVLADRTFIQQVVPQVLNAFIEDRPLVTLELPLIDTLDPLRRASRAHVELVRQLRSLPEGLASTSASSMSAPSSGFDSGFDSRAHVEQLVQTDLDPDRAQLLNALRRGLVDPAEALLTAGYGPGASLVIDFATGVATLDPRAEEHLRVMREVPYLARGARPGDGARSRELDLVVWDIALAAGGFRLLHSPVNWWRAPLIARPGLDVSRFTTLPQHRAMARCLSVAPISPAELRRRSRVSLADLRGFLQACLFLGQVHWVPMPRS